MTLVPLVVGLSLCLSAKEPPRGGALGALQGQNGSSSLPEVTPAQGRALEGGVDLERAVKDCDDARNNARLREAVTAAFAMVDSCLIGQSLSLDKGHAIKREARTFKYVCGDDVGQEGGRREWRYDAHGKIVGADLRMNMAPEKPNVKLGRLDERVFHEMIHAIDRRDRLLVSPGLHAQRGFPDPVYGCTLACYHSVGMEEIDRMNNTMGEWNQARAKADPSAGVLSIEPLTTFHCGEFDGRDCPMVQKFARLCTLDRALPMTELKKKARKAQMPMCVMNDLLSDKCTERACNTLYAGVAKTAKANGDHMTPQQASELLERGRRLVGALDRDGGGLSGEDKRLYDAAVAAGSFDRCE